MFPCFLPHPRRDALRISAAVLASATLSACSAPQGGGQTGHDGSFCHETVTTLTSPEASSPLGFRGADVLAFAEGSFQSPIHWLAPTELASFGPEQGQGQINVTFAYAGGEVRFVESKLAGDDGAELDMAWADCKNRLEVDVEMTLTTQGGALNEVVAATLAAPDPRWAQAWVTIDAGDIDGAFFATPQAGFVATGVEVSVGVSTAGTSWGTVAGTFEMEGGDTLGQGFASYATWPGVGECFGDVVLPVDASFFSFTALDAISLASSARPASLTWTGGGASTLTTSLEMASDVVCAWLTTEQEKLTFDARWIAVSEDGRIDSGLPVLAEATVGADGSLEVLSIYSDGWHRFEGVAPEDFAEAYGVSGFDLSAYDEASAGVTATFVSDGNGTASTAGRIDILGLTIPPCVSNPPPPEENGGGACEGTQNEVVGSAEWE